MELRCGSRILHGIVTGDSRGQLEVTCRSTWCGKRRGTVVVHDFDLSTGKCNTRKFAEPITKEESNGIAHQGNAVRSASG